MEAVAAAEVVTLQPLGAPVVLEGHEGVLALEVVQLDVAHLIEQHAVGGLSRGEQILHHLLLAVDGDRPPAGQLREGDAMTGAVETQLEAVMDETLPPHPLAHSCLSHQLDGVVLEHPGAHALLDVLLAPVFEDDRVDAGQGEELREHQAGRSGADDPDLALHADSLAPNRTETVSGEDVPRRVEAAARSTPTVASQAACIAVGCAAGGEMPGDAEGRIDGGAELLRLPMFPLGTVLYPHAAIPLHVFEPRYRQMTQECLEGTREFGVVLIARGTEVGGGDERFAIGTVARIEAASPFPDGRYALVCEGTRRIVVEQWLPEAPYPNALVRDLPSIGEPLLTEALVETERAVRRARALLSELGEAPAISGELGLAGDPEAAAWQLCAVAPLNPYDAQKLLEVNSPRERLTQLRTLCEEIANDLSRLLGQGNPEEN